MPRPPGEPDDEQKRLLAKAVAARKAWLDAEEEMWKVFREARAGGVQANHLLDAIGEPPPSRATFFRHIKD